MGLLYGIGVRIMNFLVFFLIVILIPGLPPRTTFPYKSFEVARPKELKGALEANYHLEGTEHLLEGRVYGPECLITRNNEVYTGIHGGEVIKLTASGHVTHVTKLGQPCEDIFEEARCGRPLGLAFDTQGNNLIIADAYYGIWLVDLATNKKKLLISPQQELPGKEINRRAMIFNSVAVDQQGAIYWTDSSSDFTVQDLVYTSFANPSGRLFKYDRIKNESKVLLDELYFTNGVALSPNEDFVVVAETGASRLIKYHLKGAKAGQSEVFVEGLPGLPDNITPDADGLWVPLIVAADNEHPNAFSIFINFPSIRLFLARMLNLFEMPFRLINNAYPNKLTQRFVHFIGNGESVMLLSPKRTTIVRLDWNGNIVGSLHGFDRSAGAISHVLEFNDHLLLGSPYNRFLARVKSPKSTGKQPTIKVKNVRYEDAGVNIEPVVVAKQQQQQATTAKPAAAKTTTTTKRPTTTTTTTTTQRPTTTTTTQKPTQTTTKATPQPTQTTTKATPKPTKRVPPKEPAPIKEAIPNDRKPPKQQEKLKVINQHGEHVEL